jgi:hypothetical protein
MLRLTCFEYYGSRWWNIPTVIVRHGFKFWPGDRPFWAKIFMFFLSSSRQIPSSYLKLESRLFHYVSFSVNYSLIFLTFDTLLSELLTSLNKPQIIIMTFMVGPEVLTAVGIKMAAFWVVAPCRLVWVYQRFRGLYCPDDGGSIEFWNVGKLMPVYPALQPRRQPSSTFMVCQVSFMKS